MTRTDKHLDTSRISYFGIDDLSFGQHDTLHIIYDCTGHFWEILGCDNEIAGNKYVLLKWVEVAEDDRECDVAEHFPDFDAAMARLIDLAS